MTTSLFRLELVVRAVRWIARISATLIAGLILLMFSHQPSGLAGMSAEEAALMVAFVALWLGLVLGWKWELLGGLVTLSGLVAFYLFHYVLTPGELPKGPYFFIFASPGVLYLFCGLVTRVWEERSGA